MREPIDVQQCLGCGEMVTIWSERQLSDGDPLCSKCRRIHTTEARRARRAAAAEATAEVAHPQLPGHWCKGHEWRTSPTGKRYCVNCLSTPEEVGGEVIPNRRASALRGRPAMQTNFGHEIDPDEPSGKAGGDLDGAMKRYEIFHEKAPIRVVDLDHDIPTSWSPVGDALSVMYRTDKWKADGNDIDYKHLHDEGDDKPYEFRKGVRFYEPASEVRKSTVGGKRRQEAPAQRLPVAVPGAITLLGYCLGFFVKRYDDEEIYEVNPRGCYLFSSPSGNLLLIYSPDRQPDGSSGFLGAMAGGKLRVLKDGIDG